MLGVNFYKNHIKFSGQHNPNKFEDQKIDKMSIRIILLGYLEDFETLSKLFWSSNINMKYKHEIYAIVSSYYTKINSKISKTQSKSKLKKLKSQLNEAKRFLFDPKVVRICTNQSFAEFILLFWQLSSRYTQTMLQQHFLDKSIKQVVSFDKFYTGTI